MSELRRCPIRGHQVILAPERLVLPAPLPPREVKADNCPLCPGGAASRWNVLGKRGQAFVVPNGRPALRVEGRGSWESEGPYQRREGLGAHEVIVEARDHGLGPVDLGPQRIADGLLLAQERMRDLCQDPRLRSMLWFKVHRPEAGARVDHPYAQLVALPEHSPATTTELNAHRAWAEAGRGSLSAAIVDHERGARARLINEDEGWVSMVPFAPAGSFECWILPTRPISSLEACETGDIFGLARRIADLYARLHKALGDAPLRLVLRSLPEEPLFRLRLELLPVLDTPRGLALAAGCMEQAVSPEDVARFLRELPV